MAFSFQKKSSTTLLQEGYGRAADMADIHKSLIQRNLQNSPNGTTLQIG